jgi:hypothetical protein
MSVRIVTNDSPVAISGAAVYPRREVSLEELEKAENELRERAKRLYKEIETTYWDLGQCLYEIYDGVPGGYRDLMKGEGSRVARKALFEKWGYQNFGDYCEKEVGIKKRSGESLRYAYFWFEIELSLPREIKEEVKTIGRSKVYLLSGFVTNDDVMTWLQKAKTMNYETLKKAVKAVKAAKAEQNRDDEERDESGGDPDRKAPPAPETTHTVQTSLYEEQWKTYNAAMERAKALSKSEKIGHNLELICQDFLANNDFGKDDAADQKAYIQKMERRMGLKFIAIDPGTGAPVYGADLLWMLVKTKAENSDQESREDAGNGEK